ncbi:MAG: FAD-binding oxidoreductase [Betaproteobacteria bacterium]|nr:FAD-binding oxidoreductase [Betaproteobacteria bacterium]
MIRNEPYWWQAAPLQMLPRQTVAAQSDVVIVGAGYTGLSAGLTLARAGRSVQIFDRMKPGEGASTRNGGIASGNLRPGHAQLAKKFGLERAEQLLIEGKLAREDLAQFIAAEGIDCDFALTGRFTGASTAADYETLARESELLRQSLGIEAFAVPKAEQHSYLGTDFYQGGMVRMDIGGLHPAKFHAGMLARTLAAGAQIHGETAVTAVHRDGDGYQVTTARGVVKARHVILGTNGYTDKVDPWLRRRMVPVRSRIIATAPLPGELMQVLMPKRYMLSETRKLHYYYRPSPDGQRILFGGRDGTIAGDPSWPSASLRRALIDIFPQIDAVEITHSWFGHVAMNRDMIPRIFTRSGVRYAAGYCGSGVVWARWAGQKAALQVLGEDAGRSALDLRPPPAVPFYTGTPYFMPAVFAWLSLQDRMNHPRRLHRAG